MAIDYVALKAELQKPAYAALVASGSDNQLADLLNAVSAAYQIDREVIPAHEVIDATVPAEWAALSAAEKERYAVLTGAGQVNVKSANVRAAFLAMFGAGTATRTALAALQKRDASLAENLFGAGTHITHIDVAIALRRT
jgi:hypothetical protein